MTVRWHVSPWVAGLLWLLIHGVQASSLLIEQVTVLDGTGGAAQAGRWVLVTDGYITDITAAAPRELPESVQRIDGRGRYLIPGLMDMHVHIPGRATLAFGNFIESDAADYGLRSLHSYLYFGVTSVYDAGNVPDYILQLRDEERRGLIMSPRIFATGAMVTYPGSHGSSPWATLIEDWPGGQPALDAHIARAPDVVKLTYEERGWAMQPMVPKLPLHLMTHILRHYREQGVRSTVHVTSEYRARQAIAAGVDSLAHPIIQSPITDDFADLMAQRQIPMVTTLAIAEMYHRLVDQPEYLDQPSYRAVLSAAEIEQLRTTTRETYRTRPATDWWRVMTPVGKDNLRRIHAAGGVLVAGTDRTTGADLLRELELLVEAGIPAGDVLRIATLNGARFLGKEDELGSVTPGKRADLVLLSADPTQDIRHVQQIVHVIKDGVVVDRDRLRLLSRSPRAP